MASLWRIKKSAKSKQISMWSRDRWQEMFYTLQKNKLRTSLSGFSVALGIFIFVVLFGFGNGLKNSFEQFFVDDSTNSIWLYPGQTEKPYRGYKAKRRIIFKNDDLTDIKQNFSFFIDLDFLNGGLVYWKNSLNSNCT